MYFFHAAPLATAVLILLTLVSVMRISPLKRQVISLMLAAPVFGILLSGCSLSSDGDRISSSESTFESGLSAFESGDWEKSEQDLSAAINSGGLHPDLAEAAIRTLAISRIRLGRLDEAEVELQALLQQAADPDLCWLAIAELQLKKGDSVAAKKAVAEARKFNPALKLPVELEQVR